MIIVRHHAKCAGRPSLDGFLTGVCDCKVAPMDDAARKAVEALVAMLDKESRDADEDLEYLVLRLDLCAKAMTDAATRVRRRAAKEALNNTFDASQKMLFMELPPRMHLLSQRGQSYGSERRCCNYCGIALWGQSAPPYVDNWDDWAAHPDRCVLERKAAS